MPGTPDSDMQRNALPAIPIAEPGAPRPDDTFLALYRAWRPYLESFDEQEELSVNEVNIPHLTRCCDNFSRCMSNRPNVLAATATMADELSNRIEDLRRLLNEIIQAHESNGTISVARVKQTLDGARSVLIRHELKSRLFAGNTPSSQQISMLNSANTKPRGLPNEALTLALGVIDHIPHKKLFENEILLTSFFSRLPREDGLVYRTLRAIRGPSVTFSFMNSFCESGRPLDINLIKQLDSLFAFRNNNRAFRFGGGAIWRDPAFDTSLNNFYAEAVYTLCRPGINMQEKRQALTDLADRHFKHRHTIRRAVADFISMLFLIGVPVGIYRVCNGQGFFPFSSAQTRRHTELQTLLNDREIFDDAEEPAEETFNHPSSSLATS